MNELQQRDKTTNNPLYPFLLATIEWDALPHHICYSRGGCVGSHNNQPTPLSRVKWYAPYDIDATSHTAKHRDLIGLIHCGISAQQAQGIYHVYAERNYCLSCVHHYVSANPDIAITVEGMAYTSICHLSCGYIIVDFDSLSLCSRARFINVEYKRELRRDIAKSLHAKTRDFVEL